MNTIESDLVSTVPSGSLQTAAPVALPLMEVLAVTDDHLQALQHYGHSHDLRRVMAEIAQLQADAMTMALRLYGEDEDTFSPETREVMTRWRSLVESHLRGEPCGVISACAQVAELRHELSEAQDAYLNMRAWAEQNGLDTVSRGKP